MPLFAEIKGSLCDNIRSVAAGNRTGWQRKKQILWRGANTRAISCGEAHGEAAWRATATRAAL